MFYLDLRRVKNASAIHAIVDGGNRACVSVSCGVEQERCETYAGHKVSVTTQASLKEISLVRRGVVQQAFALTTDNMCNPSIAKLEEATMFKICRANHKVRKATHAILDDAAQLKARVDRLCAQAGLRI